ncbi:putative (di)nucleoside polyphosphate hydrolase [Defluviimonas denitrificans]|jgi:putative (di)nucleoside polyphosphate hydrolase|uniref:RNA pyrophosphohydrolase n=1 Tax=Albidovulum denitrificans TaxID=404881 RepID=A0A2S8RYR0_9RHOB|nr:RNA pyrophosphohydrolase [Defluviimonas denitrificans]PQV53715.1 putative (di)nucleoside polyphosphate hydrolase [Defluviimonas denitrificans]
MTSTDASSLPYRPCAGVMLLNPKGLIFAGQRKDNPVSAWQMPQGGIDAGEKPRAAALRELWEETGVTADLVEFIAKSPDWLTYDLPEELLGRVWGGKFRGQRQRWFLFRFLGRDDQIDIATEHPEFSEWRWVTADEMLASIVPFKRAVYAEVVRAFRDHLA